MFSLEKFVMFVLWQNEHHGKFVKFQILQFLYMSLKSDIWDLKILNCAYVTYSFLIAVVKSYHKPDGLKQRKFIIFLEVRNPRWVINMAKIKYQQNQVSAEPSSPGSRGEPGSDRNFYSYSQRATEFLGQGCVALTCFHHLLLSYSGPASSLLSRPCWAHLENPG